MKCNILIWPIIFSYKRFTYIYDKKVEAQLEIILQIYAVRMTKISNVKAVCEVRCFTVMLLDPETSTFSLLVIILVTKSGVNPSISQNQRSNCVIPLCSMTANHPSLDTGQKSTTILLIRSTWKRLWAKIGYSSKVNSLATTDY